VRRKASDWKASSEKIVSVKKLRSEDHKSNKFGKKGDEES